METLEVGNGGRFIFPEEKGTTKMLDAILKPCAGARDRNNGNDDDVVGRARTIRKAKHTNEKEGVREIEQEESDDRKRVDKISR